MWLPQSACPHPPPALFGEVDSPKGELWIMCGQCGSAWDIGNIPGTVIDTLEELLTMGAFQPKQVQRAF